MNTLIEKITSRFWRYQSMTKPSIFFHKSRKKHVSKLRRKSQKQSNVENDNKMADEILKVIEVSVKCPPPLINS